MFTGKKLSNEELVLSYRDTRDEGYLAELMRQNKGLLYMLVEPFVHSIPNSELEDRNVYVLDYVKERLTFNAQLTTTISYGRDKFPMVERVGIETNQYQKALAQELRRLSLLPVININTTKDKVTRAMRRSANFENHKVFFREGMDDLEECLLLFPEVDHDDLFDALDHAMTVADAGNEIRVLSRKDFTI